MDSFETEMTVECPFCGEDIYDDVDQCPHCRQYVSAADFKKRTPTWAAVIVVLVVVVAMLLPELGTLLQAFFGR